VHVYTLGTETREEEKTRHIERILGYIFGYTGANLATCHTLYSISRSFTSHDNPREYPPVSQGYCLHHGKDHDNGNGNYNYVVGYTDPAWTSDSDDRRSQGGCVFLTNDIGAIS